MLRRCDEIYTSVPSSRKIVTFLEVLKNFFETRQRHIEPVMWRLVTKMWRHSFSSPPHTQKPGLGWQVQQERTQAVCSYKVGRSRLAQRHSRNGPRTHEYMIWLYIRILFCIELIRHLGSLITAANWVSFDFYSLINTFNFFFNLRVFIKE